MSAVSARSVSHTLGVDRVRALQRVLYRCAKQDRDRRFHALYDKVARSDVLWKAWGEVRANRGAPGVDGITIDDVVARGVGEFLDELAADEDDPEAAVVSKETVELAYLVAIQRLAPLQRAILILRDVLGSSAKETAAVLETSVPAVNSALQRARAAMKGHLPEQRSEWPAGTDATAAERELLERYVEYSETPDPRALERLLSEDVRFSMPPQRGVWQGRDVVLQCWVDGGFGTEPFGSMRCLITRSNRQPAVACYIRRPGDDAYTPLAIDVLRIADIVTFDGSLSGCFGLPEEL